MSLDPAHLRPATRDRGQRWVAAHGHAMIIGSGIVRSIVRFPATLFGAAMNTVVVTD